jgi:superfamily II DNA or RNA helicase
MTRLLRKWGCGFQINDLRKHELEGIPLWAMPNWLKLRDYQESAIMSALRLGRGVIDSPPRTGKTIMMAELVRSVACRTIITAPTEAIAEQTYHKLLELFAQNDWSGQVKDCSADFYLLVGGAPKSRKARAAEQRAVVTVTTAATAVTMPDSWWERVLCLIVDERHHQGAKTYHKINDKAVSAFWRWGFTGTDFRSNPGEQVALEACLGRKVAQYSIGEMTDRGVLVPGKVEFWPIDYPGMRTVKFSPAYKKGIVESELRNKAAVAAAGKLQAEGRKVLVLVHQIKHGQRIAERIPGARFVEAADGPEVRAAVAQLDRGEIRCLVGTPVVGEGLDCPAADALVYVKGYKAKVTHTQDTFRVLTGDGLKQDARIIDFADRHNEKLLEHSIQRMKHYVGMGMKVDVLGDLPVDLDQLSLYQ